MTTAITGSSSSPILLVVVLNLFSMALICLNDVAASSLSFVATPASICLNSTRDIRSFGMYFAIRASTFGLVLHPYQSDDCAFNTSPINASDVNVPVMFATATVFASLLHLAYTLHRWTSQLPPHYWPVDQCHRLTQSCRKLVNTSVGQEPCPPDLESFCGPPKVGSRAQFDSVPSLSILPIF